MLRRAWKEHRWLTLAFGLALIATLLIAIRMGAMWAYWSKHREVIIQPWMTIGYVARSYGVHRNSVFEALRQPYGLERGNPETIAQIAERTGKSEQEVIFAIALAVREATVSE